MSAMSCAGISLDGQNKEDNLVKYLDQIISHHHSLECTIIGSIIQINLPNRGFTISYR
jgi:hypothetical protein